MVKIHYPVGVALFTVGAGGVAFDALDVFSDLKAFFVSFHRPVSVIFIYYHVCLVEGFIVIKVGFRAWPRKLR
jgi:hypothetical protein